MRLLLIYLFISFTANSQTIIEDSVFFEFDKSYRTYKVWLPEDYDSSRIYVPIYCLDASLLFNLLWSNVEVLSFSEVGYLPPSIVVGIYFNERNEDMGIDWDTGELSAQGKSFKNFVSNAIMSNISNRYSVSKYATLVGHSNSSTYAQTYLLDEENPFDAILTMSEYEIPALRDQFVLKDSLKNDYVFASAGKDDPFRFSSGFSLDSLLDSLNIIGLNHHHIIIEEADHITLVNKSLPIALELLFSEYVRMTKLPEGLTRNDVTSSSKAYMDSLLTIRNSKYGSGMDYGWNELNALYDLQILLKDSLNIGVSTAIYATLFPEYHDEYFLEGQILEQMGAFYAAEKSYLRHFQVFEEPGLWSYKRIIWLYAYRLNNPEEAISWCQKAYLDLNDNEFIELLDEIVLKYPNYGKEINKLKKKLFAKA